MLAVTTTSGPRIRIGVGPAGYYCDLGVVEISHFYSPLSLQPESIRALHCLNRTPVALTVGFNEIRTHARPSRRRAAQAQAGQWGALSRLPKGWACEGFPRPAYFQ